MSEGREGAAARLFRSKRLSCTILTAMADLQGALARSGNPPGPPATHTHTLTVHSMYTVLHRDLLHTVLCLTEYLGSSPPLLISAASSGLSRLLDYLLNQSESGSTSCSPDEATLSGRLQLGLSGLTSPQPDIKVTKHTGNCFSAETRSSC